MVFEFGRQSPAANHLALESVTGSIYRSESDQRYLELELLDCGDLKVRYAGFSRFITFRTASVGFASAGPWETQRICSSKKLGSRASA